MQSLYSTSNAKLVKQTPPQSFAINNAYTPAFANRRGRHQAVRLESILYAHNCCDLFRGKVLDPLQMQPFIFEAEWAKRA